MIERLFLPERSESLLAHGVLKKEQTTQTKRLSQTRDFYNASDYKGIGTRTHRTADITGEVDQSCQIPKIL